MFHRFTITSVERNLGFAIQETPKPEHHWLVVEPYPSKFMECVSWDDDIPNIWEVIKVMFQSTNQMYCYSNY
jgi:hypothetical protein